MFFAFQRRKGALLKIRGCELLRGLVRRQNALRILICRVKKDLGALEDTGVASEKTVPQRGVSVHGGYRSGRTAKRPDNFCVGNASFAGDKGVKIDVARSHTLPMKKITRRRLADKESQERITPRRKNEELPAHTGRHCGRRSFAVNAKAAAYVPRRARQAGACFGRVINREGV